MSFIKNLVQCNKSVTQSKHLNNYIKKTCFCTKPSSDNENKTTSATKTSKESPLKGLLDNAVSFEDARPANAEQLWATLPYPQGVKIRKQGVYDNPKIDPRNTTIIMFPGQGNQFVGMAKDLLKFPMARDLFDLANYVLGYDLLKICLKGPQSTLDQTIHCQPATLVTSLAALERLKEERPNAIDNCVATAGFSLGEITALVFAGAIPFERALRLVKIRAEAMQLASEAYEGAMARIIYGPDSKLGPACIKAKEWCLEKGVEVPECKVAAYLYPHSKIVAGSREAIEFLEKNAKEFKLRKIQRLKVSGAFHTDLMLPAVEPFKKALQKAEIENPVINVHSNVDGKRYKNAEHIKKQLPKQIVKPVKWEQTLHVLFERDTNQYFPKIFECGPGTFLKGVLKQVNAKAWDHCYSIEA